MRRVWQCHHVAGVMMVLELGRDVVSMGHKEAHLPLIKLEHISICQSVPLRTGSLLAVQVIYYNCALKT